MLAHIRHVHTETALSLVHQKRSCLENSLYINVLCIEVMESHIVLDKAVEVSVNMQEFINHIYVRGLIGKVCILSDKFEQCFLPVLRKQASHQVCSKRFCCSTGLRSLPCGILLELRTDSSPVIFGNNLLVRRHGH